MSQATSTRVESIVLGGGCFWCLEAAYQLVEGVGAIESGYAGGDRPNPTYEQVSTGISGHAEVVKLSFNPDIISLTEILDIFWVIHDPTTKDRQGYDVGSQYRSIILYADDDQKQQAQTSKRQIEKQLKRPVVTEVMPLTQFYKAEDYHQNYYRNNPAQGYCQVIINPKLAKLRQTFAARLKRKDSM